MIFLSTGLRKAMCGIVGCAGALANGILYIYSGSQPISADAAPTGNLCARITLASGAFVPGTATNGINLDYTTTPGAFIKTAGEVWSGLGLREDTAGWWRFMGNPVDSFGVSLTLPRIDGNVATGGGDLNLGTIACHIGEPLTIDVFSYLLPAS